MNLHNQLLERIIAAGYINIADYMATALRHPELGYYTTRDPFGSSGDFITAPEVSQLFGEMVALWALGIAVQINSKNIALVELGPGRGTMMTDILRTIKKINPALYDSLTVHLVEISPKLKEVQRKTLSDHRGKITWHESINTLPDCPSIIAANEFFDALPVQQFIVRGKSFHEIVIKENTSKLAFAELENPIPKMAEIADGKFYEYSAESQEIVTSLSKKIVKNNGAVLIIDYGYKNSNGESSLQAVKDHKFHDFLESPGEADLTAHVNFSDLARVAKENNAATTDIVTQREFLSNLGIIFRAESLKKNAGINSQQRIDSALERLTADDQMGKLFKAMTIFSSAIKEPPGF